MQLVSCSHDDDITGCRYHGFLQAAAANYPASGFLEPAYAANVLTPLLEEEVIAMADVTSMQYSFPELHQVLNKCGWSAVPEAWKSFLKHLVQCACRPQHASEVTLLISDVVPVMALQTVPLC